MVAEQAFKTMDVCCNFQTLSLAGCSGLPEDSFSLWIQCLLVSHEANAAALLHQVLCQPQRLSVNKRLGKLQFREPQEKTNRTNQKLDESLPNNSFPICICDFSCITLTTWLRRWHSSTPVLCWVIAEQS